MAKKPVTVNRIKIICEVESEQMGPIIIALTDIGVTNITHELVTDVIGFKQNRKHETVGAEFAIEWLVNVPSFTAIDLVKHFRGHGRTDGGAYAAIKTLTEKGVITRVGPGQYTRADVKAIEHQKPKAKPKRKKTRKHTYEISNYDLIMQYARRSNRPFTLHKIKELLEANGRPVSSATPSCVALVRKKLLRRVGEGLYQIYVKKTKLKPRAPQPHEVVQNGNNSGVASNG